MVTKADIKHLEDLIVSLNSSLESEMRQTADRIEGVAERHSRMIVAGTASISAVTKAITRLEAQAKRRDENLRQLRERVAKLERRARP